MSDPNTDAPWGIIGRQFKFQISNLVRGFSILSFKTTVSIESLPSFACLGSSWSVRLADYEISDIFTADYFQTPSDLGILSAIAGLVEWTHQQILRNSNPDRRMSGPIRHTLLSMSH